MATEDRKAYICYARSEKLMSNFNRLLQGSLRQNGSSRKNLASKEKTARLQAHQICVY